MEAYMFLKSKYHQKLAFLHLDLHLQIRAVS
nr:MAG TPA: hypothetical protein [Bacteriophage sp.]